MLMPTLHTERLVLRPFVAADAPTVQVLAGNRLVADTTTNIPHPYPDGAAERWMASHAGSFVDRETLTLAVTRRDEGRLLGAVSLIDIQPRHQRAEVGYWIGVEFWGQGVCTEAVAALMDFARTDLEITRFVGRCYARNPASARVMEKCGMTHEGTLRQHVAKWGKFEDMLLYGQVLPQRSAQ